ncbi:MAG: helix-turn-helix domain-containing protein, partial [Clostridia bacterium]|nr:helix-turn-helix domain-containing protein [Clostridia bacterium]
MTTGEKITSERKKLNLTQQQFADELGVTRQAVSRWESDLAFPETDTLIKMSKMFNCSIDYLLKYDSSQGGNDGNGENGEVKKKSFDPFKWSYEYKSEKQVFGMPLVHINIGLGRRAHGFFSVGLISSGIISLGLLSAGVVSLGLLSIGLIAFGILVLGGLAFGSVALGVIAVGGVAVGIISLGGVAVGLYSLGGCAIGAFACGGYANGSIVAVGDYAVGNIAIGKSTEIVNALSLTKESFEAKRGE